MQGPWDDYSSAPSGESSPGGLTRITPPKAPDPVKEAREARSEERSDTNTGLSVQSGERSQKGQVQDFRKEFTASLPVKTYGVAVTSAANAVKRGEDASGDIALIYDYAKAMDPESVVRESEVEMAQGGQSMIETAAARYKKEFGVDGGGVLDPKTRERLRREIISAAKSRRQAYEQQREYFTGIAQRNQFNPEDVIGPHLGEPYRQELSQFGASGRRFTPEEMAARANGGTPPRDGFLPGATPDNIAFDMDTGSGAFGSDPTGKRLSPADEREYSAFIQSNRGNMTPALLNSWWESKGFGGLSNADEVAKAIKDGTFDPTVNYQDVDQAERERADAMARERYGEDYGTRASSLIKGGTMNWSDEIAGGVGALANLVQGENPVEGYQRERDIERSVQRKSRNDYGVGWEIAGGLATPLGWMKAPKNTAEFVGQGAKLGALAGAGEGEGVADTLGKAGTGGGLGAAGGYAIDKAAPVVAPIAAKAVEAVQRIIPKSQGAREFAEAAERQGLDYLPADRPGAAGSQMASSLARVTLGGIPLARKADQVIEKAAERKAQIAESLGPASDVTGAGQAAKRGLASWEQRTSDRASKLYDAIPIKPSAAAEVANSRAALAGINSGLGSNPALSELVSDPTMKAYQAALAKGGLSWSDLKKFRSFIGEKRGAAKFTDGSSKGDLDRLYAALSDDMRATATAQGPGALRAFTRANDFYRGREERLESVSKLIFGNDYAKSDEAAFNQLMSWARKDTGDFKRLSTAVRSLPEEEANIVRATIIDRLGRANSGGQDDTGAAFSPATFMTNWSNLDRRAKNVLFQGEHGRDLDDFAKVMSGIKGSERFTNRSQTGLSISGAATASTLLDNLLAGGAISGGQLLFGRLMGSPTFARWLSSLTKKVTPKATLHHIEKLGSIARSEPALASDIFGIQQRLASAYSQPSALRSAAEENDELGERPPARQK